MTIAAWVLFITIALICVGIGAVVCVEAYGILAKVLATIIALGVIIGTYAGFKWYYTNTASGQRAIIDQRSELGNGIDRTINVYTASGEKMATYEGKIDIDTNDGGYVKFDFEGKRYIYYNCFIETIADIGMRE